jgi:hypothetical protein
MSGVASTRPRPSLDGLAELARLSVDGSTDSIERILSLARAALDMDVAVMAVPAVQLPPVQLPAVQLPKLP